MTRYVSLSTDANVSYAAFAPIVARCWRALGYSALVHVHDAGWDSTHGEVILSELRGVARVEMVASVPRFATSTTMQVVRLGAACHDLAPDDFVLTSDVDLFPLSRSWFADPPEVGHLRAATYAHHFNAWFERPSITMRDNVPRMRPGTLKPWWRFALRGHYRLPMSYAVATVERWREMFPECVAHDADPAGFVRAIADAARTTPQPATLDHTAWGTDEVVMSHRFLSRPDLELREPTHAPFDPHTGTWGSLDPSRVAYDPTMVDCLTPPRATLDTLDGWMGWDIASTYFPQLRPWLARYRSALLDAVRSEAAE